MRGRPQQHLALDQQLANEPEFAMLEVAQAAMDELAAARGGALGKIALFAEKNAEAPASGIASDAGAIDAPAHDQEIDIIQGGPTRRPVCQWASQPPSTGRVVPVTMLAASLARNRMAAATSCGSTNRPIGVSASSLRSMSGSDRSAWVSLVLAKVGATAFTRTPFPAHSQASARVKLTSAPLTLW